MSPRNPTSAPSWVWALDVHAEVVGRVGAHEHHVEVARVQARERHHHDGHRTDDGHVGPAAVVQRAHDPGEHLADRLLREQKHEQVGDRAGERADRDAGQQQECRVDPAASTGQRVDEERDAERARKGAHRRPGQPDHRAEARGERGRCAERCAGGDAEDVGRRHRVLEETLHDRARHGKRGPDEERQQHTRHAQREHAGDVHRVDVAHVDRSPDERDARADDAQHVGD